MNATLKLIIVFMAGILLAGATFVLLVNPMLSRLDEMNVLVKQKKTELLTLEQQIRAYKNAQSDLSKATRKEEILSAFLLREDLVAAVLSLERGAFATGTVHELKINEQDEDSKSRDEVAPVIEARQGLKEVPYRVSFSNDFENTVQFLQYLEHLPQFTEIFKINLSAEISESEGRSKVYTGRMFSTVDGVFFIKPK